MLSYGLLYTLFPCEARLPTITSDFLELSTHPSRIFLTSPVTDLVITSLSS
jgi:hypothetical protein